VSLFTKPKSDEELRGLVYSLTPRQPRLQQPWYMRVAPLGFILLLITIILNIIFF
jgi:SSS family solute:Na+ symporter